MRNILKKKLNVIIHSLRNKKVVNKELEQILKNEIKKINSKDSLGTTSWEKNRQEVRNKILQDDLGDFLNWDVVKRTMFFVSPEIEYKKVLEDKILFRAIKESKIGNPLPYYLNKSISGNLIHHAYNILQLLEKINLKDINLILEFGGGYGSTCRLFKNLGYKKEYILFDLPEFLALQKFYLNSIGKDYTIDTIFTKDMEEIKKVNKLENTLFLATWSISETDIKFRKKFFESIKFDYYFIAYQDNFCGIDNITYFNNFCKENPSIDFSIIPIDHLRGNSYLIGKRIK